MKHPARFTTTVRAAVGILAVAVAALTLSACSPSRGCEASPGRGNLGLVTGDTANAPHTALPEAVTDLLAESGRGNATVTIVVPSGEPLAVGAAPLGTTKYDTIACEADRTKNLRTVIEYANALTAATGEVNYLASIDLAARDAGEGADVVVLGSGLQTTDPLDFRVDGLLYADATAVASDLGARGLLPTDLDGRTVYWAGFGTVAGDQADLSIPARSNLVAIWTAVIEASGGSLVLLPDAVYGEPAAGLPPVSPVTVHTEFTKSDWAKPIVLRETDLRFSRGGADFVDVAAAAAVLDALAGPIAANGVLVTITGATSRDLATDNGNDTELGDLRANAVRTALIERGVPAELLATHSVGFEWCGFVSETDAAGAYSPTVAAGNRKVVLTTPGVELCA